MGRGSGGSGWKLDDAPLDPGGAVPNKEFAKIGARMGPRNKVKSKRLDNQQETKLLN